ncbi:RAB6-interacting golgin isoform X2 [Bombina bombina]|uniref:RAB6-interacting golgin isoform X2 n=1 Tax=Bombina bombina TaxID=8345 RepID=UPI00235A4EB5|nr:RAB6-interacting golgin isoform X2 [Bombina bombina]
MAGWAGFSEEELRRLKTPQDLPHTQDRPRRPQMTNKSRQQLQREKALQIQSQKLAKQDGPLSAPSDQKLSRPKVIAPVEVPSPPVGHPVTPEPGTRETNARHQDLSKEQDEQPAKKEMELKEKPRLDQLQLEQRLMEEKNKRKKALLSKAIAERSKKTLAETAKLKRIQKQLQALDDLVSTDISILRNRIEQACVEYSQAKKRFDKAETEYVASKLDLHKKTEIKEQLTEHLCTIIQQNEMRKAKKLEELMQQLDVETDEEKLELEIEVDQMLQQQEIEARRSIVANQAEQDQTFSLEDCNQSTDTKKETTAENSDVEKSTIHLEEKTIVQESSTNTDTNMPSS